VPIASVVIVSENVALQEGYSPWNLKTRKLWQGSSIGEKAIDSAEVIAYTPGADYCLVDPEIVIFHDHIFR
jgi:hypothetical protein